MSEAALDDIVAVLPPLLQSLEALGFIARHLNPPDFGQVMEAAGTPDEALRAERPRLGLWPEEFTHLRTPLQTASDAALAAFDPESGAEFIVQLDEVGDERDAVHVEIGCELESLAEEDDVREKFESYVNDGFSVLAADDDFVR